MDLTWAWVLLPIPTKPPTNQLTTCKRRTNRLVGSWACFIISKWSFSPPSSNFRVELKQRWDIWIRGNEAIRSKWYVRGGSPPEKSYTVSWSRRVGKTPDAGILTTAQYSLESKYGMHQKRQVSTKMCQFESLTCLYTRWINQRLGLRAGHGTHSAWSNFPSDNNPYSYSFSTTKAIQTVELRQLVQKKGAL